MIRVAKSYLGIQFFGAIIKGFQSEGTNWLALKDGKRKRNKARVRIS